MAPGKLDGYRVNEFRDRESDLVISRRDYYYSRSETSQHHRKEHDLDHGPRFGRRKEHGGRDSYKAKQKDIRKREEVDDWCYSSLSARKSGGGGSSCSGKDRYDNKIADRELGEISSGSGSDGSIASASQVDGREVLVTDAEVDFPPSKKRKFSPVVWEKEENEVNRTLKNGAVPIISSLSPPKVVASSSGDREGEQAEEQDFVLKRNIPASRWADEDEGEILEDEEIHRSGENVPASGSSAISVKYEFSGNLRGSESPLKLYKNGYVEEKEDDDNNKVAFYGSDTDLEEENDYLRIPEPTASQQRSINMLHSCRSVHEFQRLNKIGAGTYGVVYQSRDKRNGELVALKKVKMDNEREGFPLTSLREINILLSLRHPSVVDVKEVVVEEDEKRGKFEVYLVMEYMEHDLRGLMEVMRQPFSQSEVKCLMLQLLEGVKYLHDNWVLHRDLKTSNILLNNCGELKICDFGLSRQYGCPLKPYTPLVVTLHYRAPELLLGATQYSTAIDMWSLGCIMAELLAKKPLFSGKSELDQLDKIFKILGTPSDTCWPGFSKLPGVKVNFVKQKYNLLREKFPPTSFTGSPFLSVAGLDLLNRLLTYNPDKRITAHDAVNHEWFQEFPHPKDKAFMPTFPVQHANSRY